MRSASLLPLVLLASCGGGATPPAEPAPAPAATQESPPKQAQAAPGSPEWELAAKGAEHGEAAACVAVRAAVLAEKACVGSLCSHGATLAAEWKKRCAASATAEDTALAADLAERAKKPPTACAERAEAIIKGTCNRGDATCEATASKWAARCGKSDGSPLVLGLLTSLVATKSALPDFTLDVRTCDAIFAEMRRGLVCTAASCPAALKNARAYRARCAGEGEPPPATTALVETAILAAAGETPVPTLARKNPSKLTSEDLPVPLADRWGAIVAVCGERPADVGRYVASLRTCEKGKVVVVRIFETAAKDIDVRAAAFDVPNEVTFTRRFPSLRALGEVDARAAAKQASDPAAPGAAPANQKPLSPAAVRKTKLDAIASAQACITAEKRAKGTERELIACHFAVNPCEPEKIETLTRALDDDRAAVASARRTIDLATTALPAAAREDIEKAAVGCPGP